MREPASQAIGLSQVLSPSFELSLAGSLVLPDEKGRKSPNSEPRPDAVPLAGTLGAEEAAGFAAAFLARLGALLRAIFLAAAFLAFFGAALRLVFLAAPLRALVFLRAGAAFFAFLVFDFDFDFLAFFDFFAMIVLPIVAATISIQIRLIGFDITR